MDDELCGQSICFCQSCFAGRAAAEEPAFSEELRSGGPMDCAVHPAAAEQRRIRGVDDGINVEGNDVTVDRAESGHRQTGIP
jgi:hypothetical protein